MTRGTTPTYTLTLDDDSIDLAQAQSVYATFRQGRRKVRKSGDDIVVSGHTATVSLTQAESLDFLAGEEPARVQLNWVYANGARGASEIVPLPVLDNLEPEVLT